MPVWVVVTPANARQDGGDTLSSQLLETAPPTGMMTVVKITFERSGGFVAAPGLTIKGALYLRPDGTAEVQSEGTGYQRQLPSQELLALRETLDSVDLAKLQPDLRNPAAADQHQYAITFHTADGKTHTVQVDDSPASELEKSAPGLGKIADWIRKESDSIWKGRIRSAR